MISIIATLGFIAIGTLSLIVLIDGFVRGRAVWKELAGDTVRSAGKAQIYAAIIEPDCSKQKSFAQPAAIRTGGSRRAVRVTLRRYATLRAAA